MSTPCFVRLPVRVASVLSAPVPEYAFDTESAWSAHTDRHAQEVSTCIESRIEWTRSGRTVPKDPHELWVVLDRVIRCEHPGGAELLVDDVLGECGLDDVGSV